MMSRVLKNYDNKIAQYYKKGEHEGIDLISSISSTDYIIAYSSGKVVALQNNYNKTDKSGNSYGNYIKIKHDNGMYTLYAHLKYKSIPFKLNSYVNKGDVIGYMGNTGYSKGYHLHFEIRDQNNRRINPLPFLDKDFNVNIKKENEDIAKEVIKGLWGNGLERKKKLEQAGYNYQTIQTLVNKMLNNYKNCFYIIKSGDTLSKIAFKYNTTVEKLVKMNNIKNPDLIFIGNKIKIC